MGFAVYILYSVRHERYYIGYSKDWSDRLKQHNSGYNKSTAPYAPWVVLLVFEKATRKEAILLERKLKNLNRRRLLKFVEKYRFEPGRPDEVRGPGADRD